MIGRILLEKLQTDKGESSILIVILFAGMVVFIVLPLLAVTFENGLVKLATQEITDVIDVAAYTIYQEIDLEALSEVRVKSHDDIVKTMNINLQIIHPQVKSVVVTAVRITDSDNRLMTIEFDMVMNPTLYRSMYHLDKVYNLNYSVQLPIDGERR